MKADTGVSRIFLKQDDITKSDNMQQLIDGPITTLPNSGIVKAAHKGVLPLHDTFSDQAKEALVYPEITNESLLSIGQICNDNCLTLFSKKNIHIFKEDRLILTYIYSSSDGLWDIPFQ